MLAELISAEFMQAMIEEYKNDDSYQCNAENTKIDEDLFKDKFPWTLDKVPEPVAKVIKKPVVEDITGGKKEELMASAQKKVKTDREIEDEKYRQTLEDKKV